MDACGSEQKGRSLQKTEGTRTLKNGGCGTQI